MKNWFRIRNLNLINLISIVEGWLNWGRFDHTRGINSHFTLTDLYYALHKFANYTQDTMPPNYSKYTYVYTLYRVAQKNFDNVSKQGCQWGFMWAVLVADGFLKCLQLLRYHWSKEYRKYEKSERNKCNEVTGSSGSSSHLLNLIFSARCTINTPTSPNTRICVFSYFCIFVFL